MAESSGRQVNARILYWGAEGAGKSANLATIAARLRPDHRGPLRAVPTALDPTVSYEVLPIELGEVSGVRTRLEAVAVPGAPELAPTRKQLLDEADGIVLVIDASRDRLEANVAAFEELRRALGAYGRALDEVPLVLQINKRDLADPYALEELHRKLEVPGAPAFEAVATEGTGVIPTLTTISKRVIRALRGPEPAEPEREEPAPAAHPAQAAPQAATPVAPAPASAAPSAPAAPRRAHGMQQEPELEAELEATGPGRPGEPAPVDLEAAAALADDGEDDDVGRARAALEGSFEAVVAEASAAGAAAATVSVDPMQPPASGGWRLVASGAPRSRPDGGLELPIELEGPEGRRVSLRIAIRLDPGAGG